MKRSISFGISVILTFCLPMLASALVFEDGFESGNLSNWSTGNQFCCSHSVQFVQTPVREGKNAVKFLLKYHDFFDKGYKRSEITLQHFQTSIGSEYWYEVSILIPGDWVDSTPPAWDIVTQWHGIPDFSEGENWRSPPLAFYIDGDRFRIRNSSSSKRVMPPGDQGDVETWYFSYQKGKWMDWKVHVKWSYGEDGLLEIWRDGKKLITKIGPNCFNDALGPYFKMGIYSSGSYFPRSAYHDKVYFGDEPNSSPTDEPPKSPTGLKTITDPYP